MTWYEFLLFVHIGAAMIWLGGSFTLQMYGLIVRRGGDAEEMARFAGRAGMIGERMFTPMSLVVVLAGIALMIDGDLSWDQLWVIFALAAFVASAATGMLFLGPTAKRIAAVGPTTPQGQALIQKLFAVLRVDLAFMYTIAFAMIVKPTSGDGWVIAAAVVVLLGLSALFLAPLRSSATQPSAAPAD